MCIRDRLYLLLRLACKALPVHVPPFRLETGEIPHLEGQELFHIKGQDSLHQLLIALF